MSSSSRVGEVVIMIQTLPLEPQPEFIITYGGTLLSEDLYLCLIDGEWVAISFVDSDKTLVSGTNWIESETQ